MFLRQEDKEHTHTTYIHTRNPLPQKRKKEKTKNIQNVRKDFLSRKKTKFFRQKGRRRRKKEKGIS
jgi:hypothetical protein